MSKDTRGLIVPKRCPEATLGGTGTCNCPAAPSIHGFICERSLVQTQRQTGKQLTLERIEQLLKDGGLRYDQHTIQMIEREMMAARAQQTEQSYGYPQRNLYPRAPLDRKLEKMAEEGHTSFISPELTHQIQNWCRNDERVDMFWTMFTDLVRSGLNDHIVSGLFRTLGRLLQQWDQAQAQTDEQRRTEYASLLHACQDAVQAFEEAKDRDEVLHMVETMEEIDAALFDIEEREEQRHRG